MTQTNGRPGTKVAQVATRTEEISAFTARERRKPHRRSTIGMIVFIPMAPTTFDSVINPDWKAREVKPELQQERQQERHRSDPGAIDEAADDRAAHEWEFAAG